MKKHFFIPVLFLLIIACNPQRQKEIVEADNQRQQLYDEVMAVHDEVMPHMQDIRRYKGQINEKIESLAKDGTADSEEVAVLNNLINQLESADDAMMNWMRAFNRDYAQTSDTTAVVFLEEQKERVIQVKEEMEAAIRDAEEALQ